MGKVTSTPLLFQSKLVCFSLLYLFTSLFLALYTSLSQTKCLFRSSPFDPIQTPLFSYPPNYREHQYAIPTQRKSCSSRVYFSGTLHFFFLKLNIGIWLFYLWILANGFWFLCSDYWKVLKEIQSLCNSAWESPVLRYMQRKSETFGGNFSTQNRISYFVHYNESTEIPCGFLKRFPISDSG